MTLVSFGFGVISFSHSKTRRFVSSCSYDCCCASSIYTSGLDLSWLSTMSMSCDAGISPRPTNFPLSTSGLSCPLRSCLRKGYFSLLVLSCHSAVSAWKTVDLVTSSLGPLSVRGPPSPLLRRVRFLHLPQYIHWDLGPAADLILLLGLHSHRSFPWYLFH